MTFKEAIEALERDERFKATISAMNTLLIQKGIYTQQEFDAYFCQWAEARVKRLASRQRLARRGSTRLSPVRTSVSRSR